MDTPRVLLEHYLKQLRLPTMLREFPKLADQCAKEGATFEQFLLRLVEQEMLDRERRATERRIKAAKFPVSKSLETYDFLAIPSLNKKLVVELARCEWIGRRENVLALGNSGTGKTHIGLALGLAACQQGFRVRFTTAASLVHKIICPRSPGCAFQCLLKTGYTCLCLTEWCARPSRNSFRRYQFRREERPRENLSAS